MLPSHVAVQGRTVFVRSLAGWADLLLRAGYVSWLFGALELLYLLLESVDSLNEGDNFELWDGARLSRGEGVELSIDRGWLKVALSPCLCSLIGVHFDNNNKVFLNNQI